MKTPHLLIVCMLTFWVLFSSISLSIQTQEPNIREPVPPPAAVREAFDLDSFYQQWIDVNGFPVLASANVSPYAVKEAAYLIRQVLGHRLDILQTFSQNKERFSIIGYNETTTQIPEYSSLQPDFYQDIRNRGLGSADRNLTTSCSEENLLHYPEDPYFGFSVLFHELAHAVHERGLSRIDPEFDNRLRITYKAAMTKGLWKDTYAAVNHKEYWAEASEAWFNPKTTASFDRFGDTREDLKAYDPELTALIVEVYGDSEWRYTPPETRLNEPHLQGFDPQNSPTFQWPPDILALYEAFTSDPESTGDGRWVNLQAYPPSELPRLQASRRDGNTILIAIRNFGVDDVHVYWVAPDGTEYFHNSLRGDMVFYDTHVGALWLLKDGNGKTLSVYRAETKMGRILIFPEAENNNSPQVKMPDANLAAAVRQELGLPASTPITEQAMQRLTTLGASAREITNLTGLEYATQLVRLDLWENKIQDVNPLSNLTQLQQLHLQANRIMDIKAFAGLTELRHLHLWGNQIRDISVLANLTKLESLLLAGNPIQDNSPLHSLLKRNPDMELDIEVVLPELADIKADINEDGRINAVDLLLVVTALVADTPTNPRTDVNGDGAVNVADLLIVIESLDDPESAAAPTSIETAIPLDGVKLEAQLNILHAENDGAFKYRWSIALLQNLLSISRPGKTRLLPNYPNPFNPETWIPYQLVKATEVQILIYDASGTVVRRLALGHQPAGYYASQSRAAYWDGKNEVGETVASGVYFYTLEADDLTATRKMLIRK
ncbi:MAG: leucine-rich repeat domain-containing protein [Candidatus Poribacteria bacterium]|nr:leucine-rich repeat domain-containing protein [Candidatus Poribacteria bacterium]